MSDRDTLVDRLQGRYQVGPEGAFGERTFTGFIPAISHEAAKEITRLREREAKLVEALEKIRTPQISNIFKNFREIYLEIVDIAEKSLEDLK